jgi:hypothetical protein
VTTIVSSSAAMVPVDWAKAAVGTKATAVESRRSFFTWDTP